MKLINKNIFLADDDEDDRMFFSMALKGVGKIFNLITFKDGEELMKYLKSENEVPQVLFLDINMPRLTGLECLEEIRKSDRWRDMVVAMYSTSGSQKDINSSRDLGAQIYIMKPFKLHILVEIIEWILRTDWQSITLDHDEFFINESKWIKRKN